MYKYLNNQFLSRLRNLSGLGAFASPLHFRPTFAARTYFRSAGAANPLDRGRSDQLSARQGPPSRPIYSTGSSKPPDRGRSDQLSARQGRHNLSTWAVQINFLLGRGCKSLRQGPSRSTFWPTRSSKPSDRGRSDQLSTRYCPQNRPTGAVQINFLLDWVFKTAR